jgi:hypothetical protein
MGGLFCAAGDFLAGLIAIPHDGQYWTSRSITRPFLCEVGA